MKIRIKLIHFYRITESSTYKCNKKHQSLKYPKFLIDSNKIIGQQHMIGKTKGGSYDDCMDLCSGAEGCQSINYVTDSNPALKDTGECFLSSIDLRTQFTNPGTVMASAKTCMDGMFIYIY